MGESQRELDLVRCDVGVAPALERACDSRGPYAEGGARNTEGAHDGFGGGEDAIAVLPMSLCAVLERRPAEVLRLGICPRIRRQRGLARDIKVRAWQTAIDLGHLPSKCWNIKSQGHSYISYQHALPR